MTKVDIFSGFLGAGKTTLIKKLIAEAYVGETLVLIENEFGSVGIDSGFLQDSGIQMTEMNAGCICCSLVGDFTKALTEVIDSYHPDRILIEPSGVGKLSDVIEAVKKLGREDLILGACVTVADATKCKLYMNNFGEFYNNQIEYAGTVVLSRVEALSEAKLEATMDLLRQKNAIAPILTTRWDVLDGKQILDAMEGRETLQSQLEALATEEAKGHCGCGHEHHDHTGDCGCGHEHHDHTGDCGCGHEHHDHTGDCGCGHEHHDHTHDCGCDHEHHGAKDVFQSWGTERAKPLSEDALHQALLALEEDGRYGMVLRAKGIVAATDGRWLHFDYVPGECSVRPGPPAVTGRLCVIGTGLREDAIAALFQGL